MTENDDNMKDEYSTQDISERINEFSSILEKFGMDLITKLGKTNFNIKVLTDKVNDLNKATIDIKALIPKLNKIIEKQDTLETEIDLLKSLVLKKATSRAKDNEEEIERDQSATDKKELIINKITTLKERIEDQENPEPLIAELDNIKDIIFEYTGGHKILYEISQLIKTLKTENEISDEIKEELKNKATYWTNKL
ncbi:MAG: hypothetical protein GF311_03395 [Candidatus Lokiarchaeota archaeon]|nr:hypothetical protein [Candidatus Lokiarchaeota archaeon]